MNYIEHNRLKTAQSAKLALRRAMLISGSPPDYVDAKLGKRKGWTRAMLAAPEHLSLENFSDIMFVCRCVPIVRIVDQEQRKPS